MARRDKGHDNFLSKVLIATIVVIWVSVVGGNWLGHLVVNEGILGKKKDAVEFREMPSPRPRPWVSVDPKLQAELDQVRAATHGTVAPAPSVSVTATPVPESPDSKGKFGLQFGAFGDKKNAEKLADELKAEGQDVVVEEIDDEDGKVFRVQGGSFKEATEAKMVADRLREKGFKVYVVSQ